MARGAVLPAQGFKNGVVAADHPLASAAGLKILRQGGNAVDAACAAAFALGVVNPAGSGIGGGGFMLIRIKGRPVPLVLDFRETAPAAAHAKMYLAAKVAKDASRRGGLAVAVPGEVAGCAEALKRHGKLSLRKVLAPAVSLARKGFPVGRHLAETVARMTDELRKSKALSAMFLPGGQPLSAGRLSRRPLLARTLAAIARKGPRIFYQGPVAREMVKAVKERGGGMTLADLAAYRPKWRQPVQGSYRGHTIFSMPPPSSGGVALIQALNILQRYPLAKVGLNSSEHLHLLAEALKHAFADRARHLGDPDFIKVPVARLTSAKYAAELAGRIGPRVKPLQSYGSKEAARAPSGGNQGTSHLSVVDRWGNAVALTTTINTSFGSHVVAGRTGIILNNQMDDFAARPGEPNAFGLIQGKGNAVAPGKRPLSSMSPTLVMRQGRLVLAAGASGGPTIITGTLQAISNAIDFNLGAAASVCRGRIHHQWLPDSLVVEGDLPADVMDNLKKRGHRVEVRQRPFTAVQVVQARDGLLYGASDPRKHGAPAGY